MRRFILYFSGAHIAREVDLPSFPALSFPPRLRIGRHIFFFFAAFFSRFAAIFLEKQFFLFFPLTRLESKGGLSGRDFQRRIAVVGFFSCVSVLARLRFMQQPKQPTRKEVTVAQLRAVIKQGFYSSLCFCFCFIEIRFVSRKVLTFYWRN